MAKEVHLRPAGRSDVKLDMGESYNDEGNQSTPLFRAQNSTQDYDYVLVYERCQGEEEKDDQYQKRAENLEKMRNQFEESLKRADLKLTKLDPVPTTRRLDVKREIARQISMVCNRAAGQQITKELDITRHFVLIRAEWKALEKYAEEMHVKVPFKKSENKNGNQTRKKFLRKLNPLRVHDATFKEKEDYFVANFRKDSLRKFVNFQDKKTFFDKVDRIYIVQHICYNASFGDPPNEKARVGLRKLIYEGAYQAGYPLHDGPVDPEPGEELTNDRQRLKRDWARFGRIFKLQPYKAIKNYFGSGIALYFAWVGFYTSMLVPLAILGVLVFLYGIFSAGSHIPVKDVCDERNKGLWYMCPLCDKDCSYWDLASTTCLYAYATHFFDNDATVVLAVAASIWATLFLKFWKRRQRILSHKWHTDTFEKEEEPLRPEFPDDNLTWNIVTEKMEPTVRSKAEKYGRLFGVLTIITFIISLVIAAVVGVVVYRAAVFASLSGNSESTALQERARIMTSVTAAFLNLLAINVMKLFYNKLAVWLTDWENPPTRSAYENSFTWKMYLFQFVNTYASVFYIAFFKSGHFIGTPTRYKRIAGSYRLDGCSEQGCFLELCIQLIILMVGQQVIGMIMEVAIPYWMKTRNKKHERYDFSLSPVGDHFMFWEYLQAVLQYGFATMFVAAFPLGPLFALLTSVIRIRVDAINFVSQFRRPDVAHFKTIGAWYRILEWVTKISVLVNAFVLAFTSEFIPKLLYRLKYAPDHDSPGGGTLAGYINNSLSTIHTVDIFRYEPGTEPENPYDNLPYNNSVCRFPGYHEDFWPYNFSKQHWEVTTARLAFVFVFQFTVFFITNVIKKLVPDVPKHIANKAKRQDELIKSVFQTVNTTPAKSAARPAKGTKVRTGRTVTQARRQAPSTPKQSKNREVGKKSKSNSPKRPSAKIPKKLNRTT